MASEEITWAQLAALMAVGRDGVEVSLSGVCRDREVVPVEHDEPCDIEVEGDGRYRFTESEMRVLKRGDLARREKLDGEVRAIEGVETKWIWLDDDAEPTAFPRHETAWGWSDSPLTTRRSLEDWRGDDFTRPVGPPEPMHFLGRAAWKVVLQPPTRKPFPITIVVDAETGLVLSQRNDGFRTVTEWTELEVGVVLPDDRFVWAGPAKPRPDYRAEHQAEMARRTEWLSTQGIGAIALTLPVEIMLHRNADDDAFEASIGADFNGSLARRRHSDDPWDLGWRFERIYRWTTNDWDWALGSQTVMAEDNLAALRAQLERSPEPG